MIELAPIAKQKIILTPTKITEGKKNIKRSKRGLPTKCQGSNGLSRTSFSTILTEEIAQLLMACSSPCAENFSGVTVASQIVSKYSNNGRNMSTYAGAVDTRMNSNASLMRSEGRSASVNSDDTTPLAYALFSISIPRCMASPTRAYNFLKNREVINYSWVIF